MRAASVGELMQKIADASRLIQSGVLGGKIPHSDVLEVQGVVAKKVEAAVLLDDTGGLGFGDGLLGMSFLKKFNFKVDQREKKLTLEKL